MKLLALVEAEEHVCCRYRLAAFRPLLTKMGYELEFLPYPTSTWGLLKLPRQLARADAVIVQRLLRSSVEVSRIRRAAKRLIFDFDDAIWLRDSYSAKGFESSKRSARFQAIMSAADVVVAGNSYLAEHASRFTRGAVEVIPTCVDVSRYPQAIHSDATTGLRLVWVGSASTLQGLERFRDVLEAIGQSVPGIKLKLICDKFLEFKNLTVEPCEWNPATEAEEIASADIGISWIPDDPWSRGKCGLKILQYQAAGLPVVTNPVGVHPEMVIPHRNGILATEPEEWIAAIRELSALPRTRQLFGQTARAQVLDRYSTTTGGLAWLKLLKTHVG
ncbi:MAG: glycosyltransferase family 4 protein [Fimbriiglobus sp.]